MQDKIEKYLRNYEILWDMINDSDNREFCAVEACGEWIEEYDFYGCDFSNNNKVFQIFNTGSSDFFPAICKVRNINKVDQYPIYYIYLSSEDPPEYIGNFKEYIAIVINNYLNNNNLSDKNIQLANKALSDLNIFSDISKKRKYKLIIID